jgi:hypothetical protein
VAETASHTWACPSCGRRVPLRAETCHCGMTRTRAEELAAVAAPAPARPAGPRRARDREEAVAAMTGDVKVLLVAAAFVLVGGLGWLVLAPSRPSTLPAVLGWVDKGPPPLAPKHTRPQPPFKLPWWK